MKYVRYEHIKRDSAMIPDAEIFTVYRKDEKWCFAMRINNQFTLTRFQDSNVDESGIKQVKKQIMFCKKYGWSYRGGKAWNSEVDEMENEFICMYCQNTTFDTSSPCVCRNTKIEDMLRKTESGIILPY